MSTPAKSSTALLIAWLVLIAGLVAAIAFFTLNGRPAATEPDAPVVPVQPKQKPADVKKPPRSPTGRHPSGQDPPTRSSAISGIVHAGDGTLVGGAHIAIFALSASRSAQPSAAPDMEEIKLLNQMIYISPEDWATPRSLAGWTGGDDSATHDDGSELASADTTDDGRFAINVPSHLGAGPFRLTAHKTGVGAASLSEVKTGAAPLEVLLGPEANVTGVVVTDVDSIPVEGARVIFDSGARRLSATSGAGGKFTVEGVTPGRYELIVAAKGHTPLFDPAHTVPPNDSVPVTLRLPRGTVLRVKAVKSDPASANTADGEPVANALVAAYCEDAGIYVMGRTNAAGTIDFPGVPAGRYSVNGMATGLTSAGEEQVVVDRNQLTLDHVVSFEPAVDTLVEVVDEDGRAVAAMDFYSVNNDEKYDALRSLKVGTTDADGKLKFAFEFEGPRASLFGFKTGYSLVRAFPADNTSGDALHLVAKKPIRIHGTVKTTDGRPIPDTAIAISITPDPSQGDDMELEIRADTEGRYDFPYLPRVEGISISAIAPDGISQDDDELELVDGQTDYTHDFSIDLDEPDASVPHSPQGMKRDVTKHPPGKDVPPPVKDVPPPVKDDPPPAKDEK
jgi:hypothetical protein